MARHKWHRKLIPELAELRETVDSEELRRVNGQRTVSVYVIPADDVALETAVDKMRTELIPAMKRAVELPSRVALSITGVERLSKAIPRTSQIGRGGP